MMKRFRWMYIRLLMIDYASMDANFDGFAKRDGRREGRTDQWTDGPTDGQTSAGSSLRSCSLSMSSSVTPPAFSFIRATSCEGVLPSRGVLLITDTASCFVVRP